MSEQRGRIQPQIHGFQGMRRQANFLNIPDNYVKLALNCNNDILGALSGRPGYRGILNAPEASPVRNVFGWKKPDGTHLLFRVAAGKIYQYNWSDPNWGAAIHSGLEDVPLAIAILGGKLFISDGVNVPLAYDGTDFTPIDPVPEPYPTAAITWKDRVYVAVKSQLYYSAQLSSGHPNPVTDWTPDPNDVDTYASNYVSVDEDNGFDIVGFSIDAAGNLIVHKENGLYTVTPDTYGRPYEINPLATIGGATTKTAIAQGERAGYYFNRRGFFLYGTDIAQKTSRFIEDLVEAIDPDNYSSIATEFFKDRFYSSVGTLTFGGEEASPSASPSPSPSVSATASPSLSPSTTPSASTSPSPSLSPSASPSSSPSSSLSPSVSPSPSPSLSPSSSPSLSPSVSPSTTPSASVSPSLSPSVTPSASVSPSLSPSESPSSSVSPSASPSPGEPSGEVFTNAVIVYDNDTNDYFLYTFAHLPTCWGRVVDNVGAERLFFGSSDGRIYEFGVGTDDAGYAIEMRIVSKPYHFTSAMEDKGGYKLGAIHNPGMVAALRYVLGFSEQEADVKEVTHLDASGLTKTYFEEGAVSFNFFSFEVATSYTKERPVLYGIELDLATEGVR